jgi:hypothetical protein
LGGIIFCSMLRFSTSSCCNTTTLRAICYFYRVKTRSLPQLYANGYCLRLQICYIHGIYFFVYDSCGGWCYVTMLPMPTRPNKSAKFKQFSIFGFPVCNFHLLRDFTKLESCGAGFAQEIRRSTSFSKKLSTFEISDFECPDFGAF